jgi:prevent-host-death family protein
MRHWITSFLLLDIGCSMAVGAPHDKTRSAIDPEAIGMGNVDLKKLKSKLREYVRRAAHGERFVITDRGRVLAELLPPRADRRSVLTDATLAEAVQQGWLTLPALVSARPPPRKPIARFSDLMGELRRDREER